MNGVVDAVVRALMIDAMNFCGVGKDAALAVPQHGVVLPAAFPELVDDLHVFVGDLVAVVVPGLLVLAGAARGTVEVAGDDVPADAALGEVIERRHPPRERVGRLEGQIAGDAEAEILRHRCHCGEQQQRLVRRRLCRIAQRSVRAVAIDVVDPEHVGQKQPVETATLQRFGKIDPVGQAVIFGGTVARMGPQAR